MHINNWVHASDLIEMIKSANSTSTLSSEEGLPDNHVITIRERELMVDFPELIQNNIKTDTVTLDLDAEWDGIQPVIIFGPNAGGTIAVEYTGEPVHIPGAVMQYVGGLDCSVMGLDDSGEVRLVTKAAPNTFEVVESGEYIGQISEDDVSLLGQILSAIKDVETATSDASSAADAANAAADKVENASFTATATTLEPGESATAQITGDDLKMTVTFGIPKGDKGDPGTAATIAVGSVTGLDAGASPTVVNSGTANAARFDFGIPKGEKGDKGDPGLGVPDDGDPGDILARTGDGAEWETAKKLGLASDSDVQLIKGGIYHEKTELKYLEPVGDYITGWQYNASGEYEAAKNANCAKFVVDGFSSIESYNWAGGNTPLAVFFDSSNRFISAYVPSTGWTGWYLPIDVPEEAAYFYGQSNDNQQLPPSERIKVRANVTSTDWNYSVRDHIEAIEKMLDSEQAAFEIEQINRRVTRDERANDFDYKEFDKAYYVFTIDDANKYLPDMYDLFHELGVPLSAAIITGNLNEDWKGDGRTVKDICDLIVADGGEILAHSGKYITADSTESDYIEVFRDPKIELESLGYDIRGIITAGGAGYLENDVRLDDWSRRYYDYSDLNGLSSSKQYWNRRWWPIDFTTIDNVKRQVDDHVSGKKFIVAAMHGSNDPSNLEHIDNVRQIVEYIKSKGDAAEITTWAHVYDTFGTTRLDKRIDEIASAVE